MSESGQERRRAPRIPERLEVAYRRLRDGGADPKSHAASTLNISASGLCMLASHELERDAHVALELTVAHEDAPLMAVGRVVWCDRTDDGFRVGICFTWLREEDRKSLSVIADFVQARL